MQEAAWQMKGECLCSRAAVASRVIGRTIGVEFCNLGIARAGVAPAIWCYQTSVFLRARHKMKGIYFMIQRLPTRTGVYTRHGKRRLPKSKSTAPSLLP
jgi:hypothetical protein